MGSAVLNKPPSPFITFVYCFLFISFLFYIPHRIVAERVKNGASCSVHGSPLGHAPNAVGHGSPKQNNPNSVSRKTVNCSRRGASYYNCMQDPKRSHSTESGESMYNWVEGETPSYNRGRG